MELWISGGTTVLVQGRALCQGLEGEEEAWEPFLLTAHSPYQQQECGDQGYKYQGGLWVTPVSTAWVGENYTYVRCYHWGKLGEETPGLLCAVLFLNRGMMHTM